MPSVYVMGSGIFQRRNSPADAAHFAVRQLDDFVHARRRIRPRARTVLDNDIVNVAFWLDSASLGDPQHGSGVASAKYLAARFAKAMLTAGRDGDRS